MTEQERQLSKKYREAVIALSVEIDRYEKRTSFGQMVCTLENIRDLLHQLYGDWLTHVNAPKDFSPAVKAQWLRELADQIETEGDQ